MADSLKLKMSDTLSPPKPTRVDEVIAAMAAFGRDNPITDAGKYWSEDNARFEQSNPQMIDRIGRVINPITSFGQAIGGMNDAAGEGSIPGMGAALLQALPVFGAAKKVKALIPKTVDDVAATTRKVVKTAIQNEAADVVAGTYKSYRGN